MNELFLGNGTLMPPSFRRRVVSSVVPAAVVALIGCGNDGERGAAGGSGAGASGGSGGDSGQGGTSGVTASDGGGASAGSSGAAGAPCAEPTPAREAARKLAQGMLDAELANGKSGFDAMAASNDGETYYTFQYILTGVLSAFEGTRDTKYLELAIGWAKTMISKATIVDETGTHNWGGVWDCNCTPGGEPIAYQLNDLQGSVELARLSRVILSDAALEPTYGGDALAIREFVRADIVDKHVVKRNGRSWFENTATDLTQCMNDKTILLGSILAELDRTGESTEKTLLETISNGLRSRLTAHGGALGWDIGVACPDDKLYYAPDTSHANRWPPAFMAFAAGGLGWSDAELDGVGKLFVDVIWDGSTTAPRFANFINGSNDPYRTYGPWENGTIYAGWPALGAVYEPVNAVTEATLRAIDAGTTGPSLDRMNNEFGKVALAGHFLLGTRATCESGQ